MPSMRSDPFQDQGRLGVGISCREADVVMVADSTSAGRALNSGDADPSRAAFAVSAALARAQPPRPLRAGGRPLPGLSASARYRAAMPAGWTLVRRGGGHLARPTGQALPLARPGRGDDRAHHPGRACRRASGPRPDQQPDAQPAGPLSALPFAPRPAASPRPALDHLPAALGAG